MESSKQISTAHKIYFVEVINASAQNKLKTKIDMIQFLLFFLIWFFKFCKH